MRKTSVFIKQVSFFSFNGRRLAPIKSSPIPAFRLIPLSVTYRFCGALSFKTVEVNCKTNDPREFPLYKERVSVVRLFGNTLLEDRKFLYRDDLLRSELLSMRRKLSNQFLEYMNSVHDSHNVGTSTGTYASLFSEQDHDLSIQDIENMKTAWCKAILKGRTQASLDSIEEVQILREFYSTLLCTSFVKTELDIRTTLEAMRILSNMEPDSDTYVSILSSLPILKKSKVPSAPSSAQSNPKFAQNGSESTTEPKEITYLSRKDFGDLAGYYFGKAFHDLHSTSSLSRDLWCALFTLCALGQVAPKIFDLWWEKFLADAKTTPFDTNPQGKMVVEDQSISALNDMDTVSGDFSLDKFTQGNSDPNLLSSCNDRSAASHLPYGAIHAALSWCVGASDIERALRFFQDANKRGILLSASYPFEPNIADNKREENFPTENSTLYTKDYLIAPGMLLEKNDSCVIQMHQLKLFSKLMAVTKSLHLDGGLRERVTGDIQRLIDPKVLLEDSPWGVINDLISGLSIPSAMMLLKQRSNYSPDKDDSKIPFYLWASLLRRCAKDHHIEEAESLFVFIRKLFPLTGFEKKELVEIMMRMYASLSPPDFSSAIELFLSHVVSSPPNEPHVDMDGIFFTLLIRAADSRNAAMMTFLEGCAEGVSMNFETFENLLNAKPHQTLAALSRKLPHEYTSSKLDSQLRIPANVDAHLRREEALQKRGKYPYDSTGML